MILVKLIQLKVLDQLAQHSFAGGPESTTGSSCGKRLGWRNGNQPDASLYSGGSMHSSLLQW